MAYSGADWELLRRFIIQYSTWSLTGVSYRRCSVYVNVEQYISLYILQPTTDLNTSYDLTVMIWMDPNSGCGLRRFGPDLLWRSLHSPSSFVLTSLSLGSFEYPSTRVQLRDSRAWSSVEQPTSYCEIQAPLAKTRLIYSSPSPHYFFTEFTEAVNETTLTA